MGRLSPLLVCLLSLVFCLGAADHHGHTKPAVRPHGGITPFTVSRLASSQSDFGFDLFRRVCDVSPAGNVFLSPVSISSALMMLLAGSDLATETQLTNALRLQFLRDPNPQATFKQMVSHLQSKHGGVSIASRIFTKKGAEIKQQFLKDVEMFHGAKPHALSGDVPKDIAMINKWVSEKTHGHIPDFVKDLPSDLHLYLLSAIFFKGMWVKPFDAQKTALLSFHLSVDNVTQVQTMSATKYRLKTGRHPSFAATVTQIPFKGNVSLVLLVPDEITTNLSALQSTLSSQLLSTLVDETLVSKAVNLQIPIISLDQESDLKKTLSDIGLAEIFNKPDLKKISDVPLRVSKVTHRATVTLNEEGVEAAAVTGVQISLMSAIRSETVKVDRPFLFLIRDDETGALLFAGKVTNPPPPPPHKKKHGESSSSEEKGKKKH